MHIYAQFVYLQAIILCLYSIHVLISFTTKVLYFSLLLAHSFKPTQQCPVISQQSFPCIDFIILVRSRCFLTFNNVLKIIIFVFSNILSVAHIVINVSDLARAEARIHNLSHAISHKIVFPFYTFFQTKLLQLSADLESLLFISYQYY